VCGQSVQECYRSGHVPADPGEGGVWRPLTVNGGGDDPSLSVDFGEVDCDGSLRLKPRLAVV
jgi:hypothetical protein